jgi:hypothetical protein
MSVVDHARSLARIVGALTDPDLRVAYVGDTLRRLPPDQLSDLLLVVTDGARAREPHFPELMLALSVALCDPVHGDLRRGAARAALSRDQLEVARLLVQNPEDNSSDDAQTAVPDLQASRPLTLGERKALARRNDRTLIARVLRDPHPDVIRILLSNPGVTEDDVVRLCARRPAVASVQRQIFQTSRWVVRYRVKRALTLNPDTPLDVSLALIHHLTGQDTRLLRSSPELPEVLRIAAAGSMPATRH